MALSRTALFVRRSVGGLFAIEDMHITTGARIFLDSTTGTDAGGYGTGPDKPVKTLAYAISLATAFKGDIIYAMPAHSETIGASGAAAVTFNKIGLKLIGLGGRTTRPAFLIDGYADTYVSITAADTYIENVTFKAGHADIAAAVVVAADGVEFHNCSWEENTTNENFLICINDSGANTCDRLLVADCEFIQPDAANTHAIEFGAAQDRVIIRDNLFMGDWGTAGIGGAGVMTNLVLLRNFMYNAAAVNDTCISIADTSYGIAVWNMVGSPQAQNNQCIYNDLTICECYGSVTSEDLNGILEPIAT